MKTTTIDIKSTCSGTLTNNDGLALLYAIENVLRDTDAVILSFAGIDTISTSFLNSSLGEIVEKHGLIQLKGRILIKNYTPAVGAMVQKYMLNLKKLELL